MNPKKRKLIVGITIPGSIALLKGQMRYFTDKGYDTYLLTQHDERSLKYCENEGCKNLEVNIARNISLRQDIKTLFSLVRVLKKERPDIINFGTPKMGFLGLVAAWLCRVPNRIYTCRGFRYEHEVGKTKIILKACEWIAGRCAHRIICVSPSIKVLGIKDGLFKEKKCIVINKGSSNGVSPELFNPSSISEEEKNNLKVRYGMTGCFIYGFLGRISEGKGIIELFEAFKKIYQKDSNTRLFVVGPWEEDHISDKTLFKRMNEHPGVILAGRTSNPALCFSVMDVFALPARAEGFGNVVVQAADMGIPVIGSTGTGVCDAVCDGFNGINVQPKNIEMLESTMLKLKNDNELRLKFAKNGPIWGKNFIPELIWEGMDSLYSAR